MGVNKRGNLGDPTASGPVPSARCLYRMRLRSTQHVESCGKTNTWTAGGYLEYQDWEKVHKLSPSNLRSGWEQRHF